MTTFAIHDENATQNEQRLTMVTRSQRRALGDISNQVLGHALDGKAGLVKKANGRSRVGAALTVEPVNPMATSGEINFTSQGHELHNSQEDLSMSLTTQESLSPLEARHLCTAMGRIDQMDKADEHDGQLVSEYAQDIIRVWLTKEKTRCATNTCLANQAHISARMRGILVDWLVEVHLKFKLVHETLYVCVNMLDRFLALKAVTRSNLQLVGIAALFIASKYQDIYPPEINLFVEVSAHAYEREAILKMEEEILSTLAFKITAPTALGFAERWGRVAGVSDDRAFQLTVFYLLDLSLTDYDMLQYAPSQVSAAATTLAAELMAVHCDLDAVFTHSRHSDASLVGCVEDLRSLAINASDAKLQAARNKYSRSRYSRIVNAVEDVLFEE